MNPEPNFEAKAIDNEMNEMSNKDPLLFNEKSILGELTQENSLKRPLHTKNKSMPKYGIIERESQTDLTIRDIDSLLTIKDEFNLAREQFVYNYISSQPDILKKILRTQNELTNRNIKVNIKNSAKVKLRKKHSESFKTEEFLTKEKNCFLSKKHFFENIGDTLEKKSKECLGTSAKSNKSEIEKIKEPVVTPFEEKKVFKKHKFEPFTFFKKEFNDSHPNKTDQDAQYEWNSMSKDLKKIYFNLADEEKKRFKKAKKELKV